MGPGGRLPGLLLSREETLALATHRLSEKLTMVSRSAPPHAPQRLPVAWSCTPGALRVLKGRQNLLQWG